jgi:molecular chaperone DnaK (HSP70)
MHMAQVKEAPDGGVLVEVQYTGQTAHFSPIQLMAMILVDEREIAVADGHPVTDCVVTVPVFYNEVGSLSQLKLAFHMHFSKRSNCNSCKDATCRRHVGLL